MRRDLLVVSCREPYVHQWGKSRRIVCKSAAGGVHTALDAILRRRGGTWVAWGSGTADRRTAARDGSISVPPERPRYRLRRVWLSPRTAEHFYQGFSNQTLWPICHSLPSKIVFRRRYWNGYRQANRAFARAAAAELGPRARPVVWIQDYQLALLPEALRKKAPQSVLAHFWHIPWPGRDMFRTAPHAREIVRSLLASDWIGFHLEEYAENFLRCAEMELGAKIHRRQGWAEWEGRKVFVRAFPIGIDAERFRKMAESRDHETRLRRLRRDFRISTKEFGIGVDRFDYAKGLIERLDALRIFFRKHPEWKGRFTFVQVAAPSREGIPAYQEHRRRVRAEVRRIRKLYGTRDWTPVCLIEKNVSQEDLSALYRGATAALVTSLRDGMNLVSKEYIASQVEGDGVLILSRFAGASQEMKEAFLVNPFDVEQVAGALHRGLRLPLAERHRRMARMQKRLLRYDIHEWSRRVLEDIEKIREARRRRG